MNWRRNLVFYKYFQNLCLSFRTEHVKNTSIHQVWLIDRYENQKKQFLRVYDLKIKLNKMDVFSLRIDDQG